MPSDTKLTDAEADALNVVVASAMGFKYRRGHWHTGAVGRLPLKALPDFCRDIHALGWMLEWADKQPIEYVLSKGRLCGAYQCDVWTVEGYVSRYLFNRSGHTAGEALVFMIVAYADASAEGQKEGGE